MAMTPKTNALSFRLAQQKLQPQYDAHKAAYAEVGIGFVSIDPRTFQLSKLPDLRAAFLL